MEDTKTKIMINVSASLIVALVVGLFAFFQHMQIFKAKTEKDITRIHIELERKGNKEMQIDLSKRLERMENKIDKLIEYRRNEYD